MVLTNDESPFRVTWFATYQNLFGSFMIDVQVFIWFSIDHKYIFNSMFDKFHTLSRTRVSFDHEFDTNKKVNVLNEFRSRVRFDTSPLLT